MSPREPDQDVTALLRQWQRGDASALERLLPLVYDELRRVAPARLRAKRPNTRFRRPRLSTKRTCG